MYNIDILIKFSDKRRDSMKKEVLIKEIETLVLPIVNDLGYELYHVEYTKEDGENYLRIYIDKKEGISLNDCEKVSRVVSDKLDDIDPIKDSYYFEVSSPGIDRILYTDKHLRDSIEKSIAVRLNKSLNSKKLIKGVLKSFDENILNLQIDESILAIDRNNIKSVNIEEF